MSEKTRRRSFKRTITIDGSRASGLQEIKTQIGGAFSNIDVGVRGKYSSAKILSKKVFLDVDELLKNNVYKFSVRGRYEVHGKKQTAKPKKK